MYGGNPSGHRRDSFVHARPLGKRGILLRQQCHHLSELGAFLELPFEGASAREGGGGEGAGGGGGESSREGGAAVRPASVRAPPGNAHAATPQDLTPPPGDAHRGSRSEAHLPPVSPEGGGPRGYHLTHIRLLACGKHCTLLAGTREVPILIKRVGPTCAGPS